MDPERRNRYILIGLAWLLTLAGLAIAAFTYASARTKMALSFDWEHAVVSLMSPVIAIVLAVIVCVERPRSGAKPKAPATAVAALIVSLLVIAGMVFTWLRR